MFQHIRKRISAQQRRRVGIAALVSLLLHLLVVGIYQTWVVEDAVVDLRPTRFANRQQTVPSQRFTSAAPAVSPQRPLTKKLPNSALKRWQKI